MSQYVVKIAQLRMREEKGREEIKSERPNNLPVHSLIWGDNMKQAGCPDAIARIYGDVDHPTLCGTVKFYQRCDGVLVENQVCGLPETETGIFALHIHEGGSCCADGFSDSGGHFHPGKTRHPNHAGDLPPLIGNCGKAYMKVLTGRFRLEEVIGRTVILHGEPDDFRTQPSGNAGKKIACGVIQRV